MFYALYPDQKQAQMRYMSVERTGAEIKLTKNLQSREEALKKYQPDEAHKLLGILTDPASTLDAQIDYMIKQSRAWNKRMKSSLLNSKLKLISFQSELAPKLRYPLPAISISKSDLKRIL